MRAQRAGLIMITVAVSCAVAALAAISCSEGGGRTTPLVYSCTPKLQGVVMYYSINTHTGNLGGRDAADDICGSITLPSLESGAGTVANKHAFASFDATYTIANMPANYLFSAGLPIFGPDGCTLIANNWADLTDGTLARALDVSAALPDPGGEYWWSGSDADGTLADSPADYTCAGFTSDAAAGSGAVGVSNRKNAEWLRAGERSCAELHYFLCIGVFTPAP